MIDALHTVQERGMIRYVSDTCAWCRKRFERPVHTRYVTEYWNKKSYYCSYTCFRKVSRQKEEEQRQKAMASCF